jgi:hypothetical protein
MNGVYDSKLLTLLNEHYSINNKASPSYLIVPAPMNSILDKINYAFLLYYITKNPESTIIFILIIVVGVIEFVVCVIIAPFLSSNSFLIVISYPYFPFISIDFHTEFELIIIFSLCYDPIIIYYNIEFLFYYSIVDYISFIGFNSSFPLPSPEPSS